MISRVSDPGCDTEPDTDARCFLKPYPDLRILDLEPTFICLIVMKKIDSYILCYMDIDPDFWIRSNPETLILGRIKKTFGFGKKEENILYFYRMFVIIKHFNKTERTNKECIS